jgi:nicotinamide-nucleotide amidase
VSELIFTRTFFSGRAAPGRQELLTLKTFTPESEIVTLSITAGLQKLVAADIYIGCTGLTAAGGSETKEKPVGTMFLYAIIGHELIFSDRTVYQGSPQQIVEQTIARLVQLLYNYLAQC